MLHAMARLFWERRAFFAELVLEHLQLSLTAILLAVVLGGAAGVAISERQRAAKPTLGVVNFLYTIPSISLLGFLIPFSGVGNVTAVIALTVYALLPMVRSTHTGLTQVDAGLLEAARGMGSTDFQLLYRIKLPLALPVILSGLRSMATMTVALAGIASFIGAGGLGVAIYRGITTNTPAMTMNGSLLTALLALAFDFGLGVLEKSLRPGARAARRGKRLVRGAAVAAALFGLGALLWRGRAGGDTIRIATKPMTEQYILGEMLDLYLEEKTGLTVVLTEGVGGGTSNIQPALMAGEFDLYPEYTGTGWNMVLGETGLYTEEQFDKLLAGYEALGLSWAGMYGFNNTYGLVVPARLAREHGLRTYSDLAALAPQLRFGAEYDFFERADGYDSLCRSYGLGFGSTMDMDIGLKYQALREGEVDVMVGFTTDGQLSVSDAVLLEDDRGFFPSYRCGNVVRAAVLRAHPELETALLALEGTIRSSDMARLNHQVEGEGLEPRAAAQRFLEEKGLLAG